ncbi:MAG: DeoR/GlpR family DNA-binding transcription regulator [Oscillospiraceae bacterium]
MPETVFNTRTHLWRWWCISLKNRNTGLCASSSLTIFTYDLRSANDITFPSSTSLVLTGGTKREGFNVLIGSLTEDFISRLMVDKVFLSADAVDSQFGISNANLPEATAKSKLLRAGREVILLADHSKFSKQAVVQVCPLNSIHRIITDTGLPQEVRDTLKGHTCLLDLA